MRAKNNNYILFKNNSMKLKSSTFSTYWSHTKLKCSSWDFNKAAVNCKRLLSSNCKSLRLRAHFKQDYRLSLVVSNYRKLTWPHLSRWFLRLANAVLLPWFSLQAKNMKMKHKACYNHFINVFILSTIALSLPSTAMSSTPEFARQPARSVILTPHQRSPSDPQQVHISLVGEDRMRISWITEKKAPSIVEYGTESSNYESSNKGDMTRYEYFLYKSGYIHHVIIGPLTPNTIYYYKCSKRGPEFSFKTPPSTFPIEFAIVGDLGQTEWTKSTLKHIGQKDYDMFLLPGDLSYADTQQPLWDTFGRLIEPYASKRPLMVTEGNHEIESLFGLQKFKSYNARYPMPYKESGSSSNLYYSFDVACGAHVIMLGSYTDYDADSDQYTWLKADLAKIDRSKTPWVVVLVHAPWYNSNEAHKGEGDGMKIAMEELIYNAGVDFVFSGHVHAYERFTRVYKDQADPCGPVYITIGDGGNREGLALSFEDPAPSISVYREPSFGHGRLRLIDEKTAHWSWQRNNDSEAYVADEVRIESLASSTQCSLHKSTSIKDEL